MPTLEDAIALAALAHKGQVDKAGAPYILHPLRMALGLATEEERIVAVLHDVVEDTHHTLEDLRRLGYPEAVLTAVECVTRREAESYAEFIERCRANETARRVKLADLRDNLDLSRIPSPTEKDLARLERYRTAYAALSGEERG